MEVPLSCFQNSTNKRFHDKTDSFNSDLHFHSFLSDFLWQNISSANLFQTVISQPAPERRMKKAEKKAARNAWSLTALMGKTN